LIESLLDVGKVNMDQYSPEYYCETTESSLEDTKSFIEALKGSKLVTPIITPRVGIFNNIVI